MRRPFHSDARFLSLDRKRCVLRFMITLVVALVASVNGVTVASAQTYPQRATRPVQRQKPCIGVKLAAHAHCFTLDDESFERALFSRAYRGATARGTDRALATFIERRGTAHDAG